MSTTPQPYTPVPGPTHSSASKRRIAIIGIVVILAVVVVIVLAVVLIGSVKPPVDVYSRPTPPSTTAPEALLLSSLAGHARTNLQTSAVAGYADAIGTYDGNVQVEITRFDLTNAASAYLTLLSDQSRGSGSSTSVNAGGQHWFTFTGSGTSYFAWRKEGWVFEVTAPTDAVRNQVAGALGY